MMLLRRQQPLFLLSSSLICSHSYMTDFSVALLTENRKALHRKAGGSRCHDVRPLYPCWSCRRVTASAPLLTPRSFNSSPLQNTRSGENESFSRSTLELLEDVKRKTLEWVKGIVIGLNLCPFADSPLRQNKIKTIVIFGEDEQEILSAILSELFERCEEHGTTLVVCPDLHVNCFERYMDIMSVVENDLMKEYEDKLVGRVQIAPFHPLFRFEGSDLDSVDNWTNRSPYPIFHILREDEVTTAVDKLDGDAGKVWRRNVELLEIMKEEMGVDTVEKIMKQEYCEDTVYVKLKDILRRFRQKAANP